MKRERVEVHIGLTLQLAQYEPFRMDVTKSAFLEEGDDPKAVDQLLRNECIALIREQYGEIVAARQKQEKERKAKIMSATVEER
jgi:hypothetical protein